MALECSTVLAPAGRAPLPTGDHADGIGRDGYRDLVAGFGTAPVGLVQAGQGALADADYYLDLSRVETAAFYDAFEAAAPGGPIRPGRSKDYSPLIDKRQNLVVLVEGERLRFARCQHADGALEAGPAVLVHDRSGKRVPDAIDLATSSLRGAMNRSSGVPDWTTAPRSMTTMESAMANASSRSWVT